MSLYTDDDVQAAAKVLRDEGDPLHSWRCSYPDVYGPCSCVQEAATLILDAVAPSIAARALRELAADIEYANATATPCARWRAAPDRRQRPLARRSDRAGPAVTFPSPAQRADWFANNHEHPDHRPAPTRVGAMWRAGCACGCCWGEDPWTYATFEDALTASTANLAATERGPGAGRET